MKEEKYIRLCIRRLNDSDIKLLIQPSTKVEDLKRLIQKETGILSVDQRLIYKGRLLSNPDLLSAYHIEEDHVIHLVPISKLPIEEDKSEPEEESSEDFLAQVMRSFENRLSIRSSNRRFLFQYNAQSLMRSNYFHSQESLEVIRQNILMCAGIMGSRERVGERAFRGSGILYECGAWLDVKDSIDQWLEAQITKMNEEKVFVHYNGWGNNWDEWIEKESPRLALFRSHTLQYPTSRYLALSPNIPVDATDHEIRPVNLSFLELLLKANKILYQLYNQIDSFQIEYGSGKYDLLHPHETETRTRMKAAQLAPILERVGRLLTEFAPHFSKLADPESIYDEVQGSREERSESLSTLPIPLLANPRDALLATNMLDRILFGETPTLEVHLHNLAPIISEPNVRPPTEHAEVQTERQMQCQTGVSTDSSEISQSPFHFRTVNTNLMFLETTEFSPNKVRKMVHSTSRNERKEMKQKRTSWNKGVGRIIVGKY